jgi:hypothetical protein
MLEGTQGGGVLLVLGEGRNQEGNGAARRCNCIRANVPGVPNAVSARCANSRLGTRAMLSIIPTRDPL